MPVWLLSIPAIATSHTEGRGQGEGAQISPPPPNPQSDFVDKKEFLGLDIFGLNTPSPPQTPESVSAAAQDVAELLKHPTAEVLPSMHAFIRSLIRHPESRNLKNLGGFL